MAIIRMHSQNDDSYPEGAYSPLNRDSSAGDHKYVLSSYAHGCVVKEREANFYHDSDFYATYWDAETGTFKETLFATTRGWCYPCLGTSVDATPEIMAKWEQHQKAQERRARILYRWHERRKLNETAAAIGTSRADVVRLKSVTGRDFDKVIKLLKSEHAKRLRSEFRKSLARQIRDWIAGDSKFNKPLSPRQALYL